VFGYFLVAALKTTTDDQAGRDLDAFVDNTPPKDGRFPTVLRVMEDLLELVRISHTKWYVLVTFRTTHFVADVDLTPVLSPRRFVCGWTLCAHFYRNCTFITLFRVVGDVLGQNPVLLRYWRQAGATSLVVNLYLNHDSPEWLAKQHGSIPLLGNQYKQPNYEYILQVRRMHSTWWSCCRSIDHRVQTGSRWTLHWKLYIEQFFGIFLGYLFLF
jgi:hypothetical protein